MYQDKILYAVAIKNQTTVSSTKVAVCNGVFNRRWFGETNARSVLNRTQTAASGRSGATDNGPYRSIAAFRVFGSLSAKGPRVPRSLVGIRYMATVFIGLPVYNGENFLEKAVQSVLNQTFGDFRLLISDNASSDATREIAAHYAESDQRIEYWRHDSNLGAAPNFNFCVERASGTYFKWMAHDDLCEPTYLERCVAVLDANPDAVLCHARVVSINDQGIRVGNYSGEWDLNDPDPVVRFSRAIALNHACVSIFGVIRLNTLCETSLIAPFVGSDRTLLAELALAGRVEYVAEPLFLWREHKQRSVRQNRLDRVAWFDKTAGATFGSLYIRQLLANERAIFKSQLSGKALLRAQLEIARWTAQNWRRFGRDFRTLAGTLIRRAPISR